MASGKKNVNKNNMFSAAASSLFGGATTSNSSSTTTNNNGQTQPTSSNNAIGSVSLVHPSPPIRSYGTSTVLITAPIRLPDGQCGYTSVAEDIRQIIEPQERLPVVRPNRAFRHFKNPPQPHMCIRDTNRAGEELFINVMSWTRIVMPMSADDPIPLYGGMRVIIMI